MDKKDFYKELMSQYTFDEEKIRRNAKRKSYSFTDSRWLPIATAAAVFVAVIGGYNILGVGEQKIVYEPSTSAVSPSERIKDIKLDALTGEKGNELVTAYLTFAEPITFLELDTLLSTFSDTGNIVIHALYDNEVEKLIEISNITSFEKTYYGAKISTPGKFIAEMRNSFKWVERQSDTLTDEVFKPLTVDEDAAEITTAAGITVEEIPLTEPEITTTAPISEAVEESSSTEESTSALPEAQRLSFYELPFAGTSDVDFISDEHFIVLTDSGVTLNKINTDGTSEEICSYNVNFPKITFTHYNSKTFVVSSEIDKKLYIVSGITNTISEVDISDITASSNLVYAYCKGDSVLIKTDSLSYTSLYIARPSGNGTYWIDKIEDYTLRTTVLSFDNDSIIYAITDKENDETKLYKYFYNEYRTEKIELDIEGSYTFVRSNYITNFAILKDGDAWIYNSRMDELSDKFKADYVEFIGNDNVFTDGVDYYNLENLSLESIDEATADISMIKPQLSELYSIDEVTLSGIRIQVK